MPRGQYDRTKFRKPQEANLSTETKQYSDGTIATGMAPLPDLSPAQQDALTLEATAEKAAISPDIMAGFIAALRQMSAENRETTLAAIREMKKPSAEEQEKADAERAQLMAQTERRVEAAKAQEADIAARRAGCAHAMPNGQTNFRGQVMSNGWAGVFCSHCWDAYTFEATETERTQSGLNVDKWGPNALAIIKNRVAACAGKTPPPVPRVPAGATIIFG